MKSGEEDLSVRIPELLASLQGEDHEAARELVRLVLELHGQALLAMLEKIADQALVERIAADPRVHGVLLLHGLHPEPAEARVRRALRSFGSVAIEEVNLANGELRLSLSCTSQSRPGERLHEKIEEAVFAAAPELAALHIEGLPAEKPFIPIRAQPMV